MSGAARIIFTVKRPVCRSRRRLSPLSFDFDVLREILYTISFSYLRCVIYSTRLSGDSTPCLVLDCVQTSTADVYGNAMLVRCADTYASPFTVLLSPYESWRGDEMNSTHAMVRHNSVIVCPLPHSAGVHEPSGGVSSVFVFTPSELGDTTRAGRQGDSDRIPSQPSPRADLQPVHPSYSDSGTVIYNNNALITYAGALG